MKDKYKDVIIITLVYISAIVIHWFTSGYFVDNINNMNWTRMEIFQMLILLSTMGYIILMCLSIFRKEEMKEIN